MTTSPTSQENEAPNTSPEPKEGSSLDDLAGRMSEGNVEPDLAEQLAQNWQKFFGAMLLVMLAIWLGGEFRTAAERKRGDASQRFENAQIAFEAARAKAKAPAIEDEGDAAGTAEFQKMRENLRLLENASGDSVYAGLAPLYRAQAELQAGNLPEAREQIELLGVSTEGSIPSGSSAIEPEQFVGELAALLNCRLLLAEGKDHRAYTHALAERARFVNLEALLILYRTAENQEQRESAKKLASEISVARPELGESIRNEFANLGAALG